MCVSVDAFFFCFFKQKTAYEMRISDWSSDVCSSDLRVGYPTQLDADRIDDLLSGSPDRLGDRQAGAQAAHHEVDGLRETVDEAVAPPAHQEAVRRLGQHAGSEKTEEADGQQGADLEEQQVTEERRVGHKGDGTLRCR